MVPPFLYSFDVLSQVMRLLLGKNSGVVFKTNPIETSQLPFLSLNLRYFYSSLHSFIYTSYSTMFSLDCKFFLRFIRLLINLLYKNSSYAYHLLLLILDILSLLQSFLLLCILHIFLFLIPFLCICLFLRFTYYLYFQ